MVENNVIRLATSRAEPVKKACSTCAHRGRLANSDWCRATGNSTSFERSYNDNACGAEGVLWERRVRRGLFGWIKVLLVGE